MLPNADVLKLTSLFNHSIDFKHKVDNLFTDYQLKLLKTECIKFTLDHLDSVGLSYNDISMIMDYLNGKGYYTLFNYLPYTLNQTTHSRQYFDHVLIVSLNEIKQSEMTCI